MWDQDEREGPSARVVLRCDGWVLSGAPPVYDACATGRPITVEVAMPVAETSVRLGRLLLRPPIRS